MKLSPRQRPHLLEGAQGIQLLATRSRRCPQPQFPPQAFELEQDEVEDIPLGPLGQLYSFTIVSAGKDVPPYGLAMVDFEPGVRVFGRLLLGAERPALDQQVRVVAATLADGSADYAFEVADTTPSEASS